MKTFFIFCTSIFIVGVAALVGVPGLRVLRPGVVRAQTGCSASSLSAPYTYNLSGTYYDDVGNVYAYGDVGLMSADGNGSLTGSDTVSDDGFIARRTFSGTYTVNVSCSGSAKIQFSDGVAASMDLAVGNGGKAISFIDTDTNFIVTGTAIAQ